MAISMTIDFAGSFVPPMSKKIEGDNCTLVLGKLTMDNSYAAGGETMDLSPYFSKVTNVLFGEAIGARLSYVRATGGAAATGKVYARNLITSDQIGSTVDLSENVDVPFMAFGIGKVD